MRVGNVYRCHGRKSNYLLENLLRLIGNNFDARVRQHHSNQSTGKWQYFSSFILFAAVTTKNVCLRPAKGFLADARGRRALYILGERAAAGHKHIPRPRRAGTLRVPRNKKASRRDYLQIIVILEL
jgi:hypothetical protein